MRPRIVDLNVDALDWTPLGPPGLYSRLLSRDTETGARTALQKLVPDDGYTPPQTAHYHHTYEEIIGVSGCFSFDSRRWVVPCTYVFHPPETVHGFASAVRAESTFLSRVGRDLDFNFIAEPEHDDFYSVGETLPPRAALALDPADALDHMQPVTWLGASAAAFVLSRDPGTGEGSAFVRLPARWQAAAATLDAYLELFVLSGSLAIDGQPPHGGRAYCSYPPRDAIPPMTAITDTLAYVNFGGDIGL